VDPAVVGLIGAGIGAAAAMGGSFFAAMTAQRRQREELMHDSMRLEAQFRHERKLADLEELRLLLDEASRDLGRGENVLTDVAYLSSPGEMTQELADRWSDALEAMWTNGKRIGIRLGSDEITASYWQAALCLQQVQSDDSANSSDVINTLSVSTGTVSTTRHT
jgi:hypothetical protein